MKFRMLLGALMLPTVVMAQQPTVKPLTGSATTLPYRVVAIQEPITTTQTEGYSSDLYAQGYATLLPQGSQIVAGTTFAAPQDEAANFSYLLPAGMQYLPGATLFGAQPQSNVRVNLNLRNAPLKEAIKQLSEQTKYEFALESESSDTRVTLVAKNIRLNTALDVLTDAAGLNWNQQNVKKEGSKESHLVFRLGKKVARNLYWGNTLFPYTSFKPDLPNQWNDKDRAFQWNGKFNELKLNYQFTPNKLEVNPKFDSLLNGNKGTGLTPKVNLQNNLNLQNKLALQYTPNVLQNRSLSSVYTLGNSLIGTTNLSETRSTFTCPNCKHQVTVIHQHQAPKCEKCGRAFHDDWDFCPFDGAKRPAVASNDWQFCPICGKSIKPDEKSEKTESKPAK